MRRSVLSPKQLNSLNSFSELCEFVPQKKKQQSSEFVIPEFLNLCCKTSGDRRKKRKIRKKTRKTITGWLLAISEISFQYQTTSCFVCFLAFTCIHRQVTTCESCYNLCFSRMPFIPLNDETSSNQKWTIQMEKEPMTLETEKRWNQAMRTRKNRM